MIVYARHGHERLYVLLKIQKLLAKGNCKAARLCGEEAAGKAVSQSLS